MNDGILIVNKPIGYTSRDIVNIVSKRLNTKKVGHTGTLDPSASGVLVLCVGKALKICELLTNHDKEYIAGVTLGVETDTLDMDGQILRDEVVSVDKQTITNAVKSFRKEYLQEVPIYSAVKVNGKKLYEYARKGIAVHLPKKKVNIYDIDIIDDINYKGGKINFKIKCNVSKGTYIRSLIRDIGKQLDVPSVMTSLVRTKLGNFNIDDAYNLDDIENNNFNLLNITDCLSDIKQIIVNDKIAFKIRNGVAIKNLFDNEMAFILDKDNNLLALYKNDNGICKTYKMFV